MKDWQNLIAVLVILSGGAGLAWFKAIPGESWSSMATLLGLGLIIGAPVTAFATGWAAKASATAAVTAQKLRETA